MSVYDFKTSECPVCEAPSIAEPFVNPPVKFSCPRCGQFEIDLDGHQTLASSRLSPRQIANLSGYLRENQGVGISAKNLKTLSNLRTPSIGERAAKLLMGIAREWPVLGQSFFINYWQGSAGKSIGRAATDPLRWLAVAWVENNGELEYLLRNVLEGQGLLAKGAASGHLMIAPPGWSKIADFETSGPKSDEAFTAMSFRPEFKALFDNGLFPGIADAGYVAIRVDRQEHNNRIDDEIIARIRQSKFLVADFTVDRGGIYFEAGYAMGLGRPVIWTVREDALDGIHFDNRQYNFILWKEGEWDSLTARLKNRIEATIGRGPLATVGKRR